MIAMMWLKPVKKKRGQTTVEYLLSFGLLLLVSLGLVQLIIFLTSFHVLRYASFMAARSYQVYGKTTLQEIGYPAAGDPASRVTPSTQTVAEAAAERILAESLLWEGWRVKGPRQIEDGIDDGGARREGIASSGSYRIDFLDPRGVTVAYCVPTLYQMIPALRFSPNNCVDDRHHLKGFLMKVTTELGVEPGIKVGGSP